MRVRVNSLTTSSPTSQPHTHPHSHQLSHPHPPHPPTHPTLYADIEWQLPLLPEPFIEDTYDELVRHLSTETKKHNE